MSSARKHFRNLAINWGGHASALLVMFFLSPYIVGKLDAVSYGIWSLLTVLTGYMGIFDLGVRSSVGRHVALYLGKKDPVGVDETIRAGFAVFSFTGLLILVAGVFLGWLFPVLFHGVPPEHYDTVRYLLPFMAVNIWLAAVSTIYSSVLTAHSRFDIARGVDIFVLFVRTVGTVYVLEVGWGLWGLAGSMVLANFVALIANRFSAGIIHLNLRSFPFLFSKLRMSELFGYGLFSFLYSSSVKIINQSDLIIVGAFISVASVREYSIGATLIYYSTPFITLINRTFFPSVQRKVASGEIGEVQDLFYKQLKISFCFGLLLYIGLVFYSEPFIKLWMYQDGFSMDSVKESAAVMSVLALSKLPSLYLAPCGTILAAMGYMRFTAIRSIVESVVNVILSLIFVVFLDYGLIGVAGGTLAARILVATVSVPAFLFYKTKFPISKFIKSVILPSFISAIVFSIICFLFVRNYQIETWFDFFLNVILLIFVWIMISLAILFPKNLREKVLNIYSFRRVDK